MTWELLGNTFETWDFIAAGFGILAAVVMGYWIERSSKTQPSVTRLMSQYRREWMLAFLDREPRIFDAQILTSLRQSTAFFASSSLIAIGGLLALMGGPDRLVELTQTLTQSETATALKVQLKLSFVVLFLVHAFLKFVWANRLFGYCAVIMASVPNDPSDPISGPRANMAGEINVRAALNFNRGLRSVYFALASLTWVAGHFVLIAALCITLWVLWSREFSSHASAVLKTGGK